MANVNISKLARAAGLAPSVVHNRLHCGWTLEEALNTPKYSRRPNPTPRPPKPVKLTMAEAKPKPNDASMLLLAASVVILCVCAAVFVNA
jgi:hypothetical protein